MGKELYLWLDLETTGSSVEDNEIIEIGCVLTEPDLTELTWFTTVVNNGNALNLIKDPVVVKMHTDNGLISDLPNGHTQEFAEKLLIDWLSLHGKPYEFILCGSGVGHFDRKFIDKYMPDFSKWLKYYVIDVGVIRRAMRLAGREDLTLKGANNKTHRALDDARLHLEEFRFWKKSINQLK